MLNREDIKRQVAPVMDVAELALARANDCDARLLGIENHIRRIVREDYKELYPTLISRLRWLLYGG